MITWYCTSGLRFVHVCFLVLAARFERLCCGSSEPAEQVTFHFATAGLVPLDHVQRSVISPAPGPGSAVPAGASGQLPQVNAVRTVSGTVWLSATASPAASSRVAAAASAQTDARHARARRAGRKREGGGEGAGCAGPAARQRPAFSQAGRSGGGLGARPERVEGARPMASAARCAKAPDGIVPRADGGEGRSDDAPHAPAGGVMALWRSGALALWRSGALALWRSGALALWRSGALALWRSGALALWRSGALALWRSGALALWRSGALALWRSGALALNCIGGQSLRCQAVSSLCHQAPTPNPRPCELRIRRDRDAAPARPVPPQLAKAYAALCKMCVRMGSFLVVIR